MKHGFGIGEIYWFQWYRSRYNWVTDLKNPLEQINPNEAFSFLKEKDFAKKYKHPGSFLKRGFQQVFTKLPFYKGWLLFICVYIGIKLKVNYDN